MTEFECECRTQVGKLRTAFIELYDSVGADPRSPQDVARKLKVNKTLAWNVARLLQAADELAAIAHVPGSSSLEKVIQATAKHGADPIMVTNARAAVKDFSHMIESHAGDRSTLDLIIDGSGTTQSNKLELSRKLAFRGNSGLYGVQAKTRVLTYFLAPNAEDPTKVDMAMISGYVGFRRLRAGVRWPLFMIRAWSASEDPLVNQRWEPLEPSADAERGFPGLKSPVGNGTRPPIETVTTTEGRDFILGDSPVGNDGAFDCYYGEFMRKAANRYASKGDDIGEFGASITSPTEQLVMDVIVDKDLDFALRPELLVFGRIMSHGQPTGTNNDPCLLPIHENTVELPGSPPLVTTPMVPGYAKLITLAYDRLGWNPKEFRGIRLVMDYPPLGANVILRFPLPKAPKA